MGFLDKFLNAVRLNDNYDEDDAFYDEEDQDVTDIEPELQFDTLEEEEPAPKPKNRFFKKMSSADANDAAPPYIKSEPKSFRSASKVSSIRSQSGLRNDMEVTVIRPTTMENTREIADTLLANCTVVLNLERIDVDLAQRIIDFAGGTCYAIGGSLQKVSSYIFILTPSNVEISGDIQDILNGGIPAIRSNF